MYTQGYNDAMSSLGLETEKTAAPFNKAQLGQIWKGMKRKASKAAPVNTKQLKVMGKGVKDEAHFKGLQAQEWAGNNPGKAMGLAAAGAGTAGMGAGYAMGRPGKEDDK